MCFFLFCFFVCVGFVLFSSLKNLLEFRCRELWQFSRRAGLSVGFGFHCNVLLVCHGFCLFSLLSNLGHVTENISVWAGVVFSFPLWQGCIPVQSA